MAFWDKLFKKGSRQAPAVPAERPAGLMLSQLAALYVSEHDESCCARYIRELTALRLPESEAQSLFAFDCAVVKKYNKDYLLRPDFTRMWFFTLKQPFFLAYPREKADILKERFLTVSELCKLIDEAEWHFWNSHERALADDVWTEICQWRLNGPGADFAMRYFEMISETVKISMDSLSAVCNSQGAHLNRYKWG